MDKSCAISSRLVEWVESQRRVPLHFVGNAGSYRTAPAPYLELVYVTRGRVPALVMGPRTYSLAAGDVALHNVHFGNLAPRTVDFAAWVAFLYIGDQPALSDLGKQPWLIARPTRRPGAWEQGFGRLAQRARATRWVHPRYPVTPNFGKHQRAATATRPEELLVKAALLELLGLWLDEAQGAPGAAATARPEAVQRGLDFIEANYARPGLRLTDIAAAAHVSADHFGRLFARSEGEPPMRRLRRVRIARSVFLLRQTDMRIEEVAREVGFEDPFHFSRTFKAVQGASPRAFREGGARR